VLIKGTAARDLPKLRRTKIEGYLDVRNLADDAALLDPLDECVACPVVCDCEAQRILRLKDKIKIKKSQLWTGHLPLYICKIRFLHLQA
jgi:hypothetical protein